MGPVADAPTESPEIELLHPFYLDTDMSMAFAAALTGGVALTREEVEQEGQQSQAVKNLRGNLRLFGLLGAGLGAEASREKTETDTAATASKFVREHTEASIFISLHDELRRSGRLIEDPDVAKIRPRDIVSMELGPAVAPLRRVVDQILRLLDLVAPFASDDDEPQGSTADQTRQQRRQQARERAKQAASRGSESEGEVTLRQIRNLFVALRDDLDQSGMVDVVVRSEDGPGVVLTLDTRLADDQTVELLHTSRFTVVGKVTQVWPTEDDVVNLFRRSVISLLPRLTQTVTWGMFAFLIQMAAAIDPKEAENAARLAAGIEAASKQGPDDSGPGEDGKPEGEEQSDDGDDESDAEGQGDSEDAEDSVGLGDETTEALLPVVTGPALQILPLAICT
jgi:hypothetical protein